MSRRRSELAQMIAHRFKGCEDFSSGDVAAYLSGLVLSTVADGWIVPTDPVAFKQDVERWAHQIGKAYILHCVMTQSPRWWSERIKEALARRAAEQKGKDSTSV